MGWLDDVPDPSYFLEKEDRVIAEELAAEQRMMRARAQRAQLLSEFAVLADDLPAAIRKTGRPPEIVGQVYKLLGSRYEGWRIGRGVRKRPGSEIGDSVMYFIDMQGQFRRAALSNISPANDVPRTRYLNIQKPVLADALDYVSDVFGFEHLRKSARGTLELAWRRPGWKDADTWQPQYRDFGSILVEVATGDFSNIP